MCLEVGCANALVLNALVQALSQSDAVARSVLEAAASKFVFFLGTDINLKALHDARKEHVDLAADLVCCSLLTALRANVIDVVLFNSPYVETDATELREAQRNRDLRAAWAGGWLGLEVTAQLVAQFAEPHSQQVSSGMDIVAWLLFVTQDRPCWGTAGAAHVCELIERRRVGDERLIMIGMTRYQAGLWYTSFWREWCAACTNEAEMQPEAPKSHEHEQG